jgi:hypothetical protein
MKGSLRPTHHSSNHAKKSLLAVFVVTVPLVGPLSTAQGEALRDLTRNFTFRLVSIGRGASAEAQAVPNAEDRAAAVTHFRRPCERNLRRSAGCTSVFTTAWAARARSVSTASTADCCECVTRCVAFCDESSSLSANWSDRRSMEAPSGSLQLPACST